MSTTADLIYHAFEQQPTKFSDVFSDIIDQKAIERIDALKIEVAQSMYGDDEDDVQEPSEPEDVENIADDIEDLSDEEIDSALADLLDSEESEND